MTFLDQSRTARKIQERLSSATLVLVILATMSALGTVQGQQKNKSKSAPLQANVASGKETFLEHCASCHGKTGKGDGPAAFVMKTPPTDLTTLAKRHDGKYPAGHVSAVLTFGQHFAAHGSEDMPVWGPRFKKLDPTHDPTGQQHIDDLVAYIQSLQEK